MTEPEDPPRLLDSLDAPRGLRNALERARDDLGSDAEVARLEARLGPLLGAPAPAPTSSFASKVGLGALALIVAGGGAWLLSAPSASVSSPVPPLPAPSLAAPTAAPPAAPSVAEAPEAVPAPSAVAPEPPSKAPPVVIPSEAELLEQARAALKAGDGARALQRASEHARRYPRGVLVQEREVLAIQALRRLGRDAEAERRTEAFLKAYPGSAFQRKLQR